MRCKIPSSLITGHVHPNLSDGMSTNAEATLSANLLHSAFLLNAARGLGLILHQLAEGLPSIRRCLLNHHLGSPTSLASSYSLRIQFRFLACFFDESSPMPARKASLSSRGTQSVPKAMQSFARQSEGLQNASLPIALLAPHRCSISHSTIPAMTAFQILTLLPATLSRTASLNAKRT